MTDAVKQVNPEAPTEKTNLLGLSREKMEAFFVSLGEKPFRAQQVGITLKVC